MVSFRGQIRDFFQCGEFAETQGTEQDCLDDDRNVELDLIAFIVSIAEAK
jgi:hypothetical protein